MSQGSAPDDDEWEARPHEPRPPRTGRSKHPELAALTTAVLLLACWVLLIL
jgi:hypothetical protein